MPLTVNSWGVSSRLASPRRGAGARGLGRRAPHLVELHVVGLGHAEILDPDGVVHVVGAGVAHVGAAGPDHVVVGIGVGGVDDHELVVHVARRMIAGVVAGDVGHALGGQVVGVGRGVVLVDDQPDVAATQVGGAQGGVHGIRTEAVECCVHRALGGVDQVVEPVLEILLGVDRVVQGAGVARLGAVGHQHVDLAGLVAGGDQDLVGTVAGHRTGRGFDAEVVDGVGAQAAQRNRVCGLAGARVAGGLAVAVGRSVLHLAAAGQARGEGDAGRAGGDVVHGARGQVGAAGIDHVGGEAGGPVRSRRYRASWRRTA